MDEAHPRKRPRPVVSCLRCREKKLKCDRTTPCENCVKAQTADTCAYNKNGHLAIRESTLPSSISPAPGNALEDLQMRMARVEEMLGVHRSSGLVTEPEKVEGRMLGTVVVKGTRTVYHGQNDRTTLLNQFLEVKDFINGMTKNEQLVASLKQVRFLQNKTRENAPSPDSIIEPGFSLALLKLREFLPPRTYCNRLINIYCQHFERTMRVLHIPTFMGECDRVWTDSNPELFNSSSILPQITVVMTMAYHMDDAPPKNDDQTHRNYLKGAAVDMIQAWLDELPRKQRTELTTLQVEVLLLLSRSLRHSRPTAPEKLWSSTGALVRSAVAMGLNMNPEILPKMPPYQIEMRRRLWATILEIDTQASITCGMPLIVPDIEPAAAIPLNLNDSDFDESSKALPRAHSLDTYTDSLYQVILATSLPQRLKAASLVQRAAPNIQEAVTLGRKVQDCITNKPPILSLECSTPDGGSLLHRVLLDLYLRRPLLCLYKPLLATTPPSHPLHAELHRSCLASSTTILQYQDLYTLPALAHISASPLATQNFFYRCCKIDILWAALGLCQHIKSLTPNSSHPQQDRTALIDRVKATISYLTDRIGHKGSDLKDIVFLALALQSVNLPEHTPDRPQKLQDAMNCTLAACRERLLRPFLLDAGDALPPAKRARTVDEGGVSLLQLQQNGVTPLMTEPQHHQAPLSAEAGVPAFSVDLAEGADQWFGQLPELAAEFDTMQGDMLDGGDVLNFGMAQEWNWEHMWQ